MSTKEDVPKRAKSAYMFFCVERRRRKEKTQWKELSDTEKRPYEEMAEEDRKRFMREMHKYVNSPIEDWRNWREFRRITIEEE